MRKLITFLLVVFITSPGVAGLMCDNMQKAYKAVYEKNQYTCPSGYYLPANIDGCEPCAYGHVCSGGTYVFNTETDQGIDIGVYTCENGYYLPANAVECVACPSGAVCNGGTFTFNTNNYQGLVLESVKNSVLNNVCADNLPANFVAVYKINQYTCGAGYYVPANNDGCVVCPANSYCTGGTYTFNPSTDQGITACSTGLVAPTGMFESSQCGRLLHLGNNNLYLRGAKKTNPSLKVNVGNDVFYGNMTTTDTPMNAGTQQKLKVKKSNTVYSIYDDTVNP